MYGMINRGIKEMVVENLGVAGWAEIESDLGIGPAEMISMAEYTDELTTSLLSASASKLDMTIEQCLRLFGMYWIKFAERGSYGSIMKFTGSDITEFISNLDRMHQAVLSTMPNARVPSFEIVEQTPTRLHVKYISEREGLEMFVIGLFEGLLHRFGHVGTVEQIPSMQNAVLFEIQIESKAGALT